MTTAYPGLSDVEKQIEVVRRLVHDIASEKDADIRTKYRRQLDEALKRVGWITDFMVQGIYR